VSNDRFKDHIKYLKDENFHPELINKEKRWLNKTRMSFQFDDEREFELEQHN